MALAVLAGDATQVLLVLGLSQEEVPRATAAAVDTRERELEIIGLNTAV